jgi:glycine cleavage system regulatory protein
MSHVSLVLTVLGTDRPGLVEAIARVVAEHGANWVESRMAHLAGQFAGILRVDVTADRAEGLADALRGLDEHGLDLIVHPDATAPELSDASLVQLELVGQDRPGIVREITHVLAAAGVNVEEFTTACTSAPTTGQTLFEATARLRLPPNFSETQLRHDLEQLATDMMVDISLHRS